MQCVVSPHCQEFLPALRSPILAQTCSKTRLSLDVTTMPWPTQPESTRRRHGISHHHTPWSPPMAQESLRSCESSLVCMRVELFWYSAAPLPPPSPPCSHKRLKPSKSCRHAAEAWPPAIANASGRQRARNHRQNLKYHRLSVACVSGAYQRRSGAHRSTPTQC